MYMMQFEAKFDNFLKRTFLKQRYFITYFAIVVLICIFSLFR